ncbi:hypothetical protein FOZ63_026427, partial [Perkinsus olseni]
RPICYLYSPCRRRAAHFGLVRYVHACILSDCTNGSCSWRLRSGPRASGLWTTL